MNNSLSKIKSIISYVNIALAFLVPTFFLTITTNFFEFNKLALVSIATLVVLALTIFEIFVEKRFQVIKSRFDLGFVFILGAAIITSIFSINKSVSVLGSEGRWFPSLFAFIVLAVYYYTISPNILSKKTIKTTLLALALGATLSTIVAILSYFGLYIGSADVFKTSGFTLTGSINVAIILAVISLITALQLLSSSDKALVKVLLCLNVVVNFFYVLLVNNILGWSLLGLGLLTSLLVFKTKLIKNNFQYLLPTLGAIVALVIVYVAPVTRQVIFATTYPQQIVLPARESWQIATSTIQQSPLLGTGIGTFAFNFNRYRPLSLNNTVLWNVNVDKPFNEIFNLLTTVGIVGTVAFVVFGVYIVRTALLARRIEDESGVTATLSTLAILLVGVYLLTHATFVSTFLLIMVLALMVANYKQSQQPGFSIFSLGVTTYSETNSIGGLSDLSIVKQDYAHYVAMVIIAVFGVLAGIQVYKIYGAEVHMRLAQVDFATGNAFAGYQHQISAINLNPNRSEYQRQFASTSLLLAEALAGVENPSETDKQNIQNLIREASNRATTLTNLDPLNSLNWETRGAIYSALQNVAEDALSWSASAYENAVQLSPNSPTLRVQLGGVYSSLGNNLAAANQFKIATDLKPDYANARYNLAIALVNLQEYDLAKTQLQVIQSILPADSPDQEVVKNDLAKIEQLKPATQQNVAGASTQKPSIEELQTEEKKEQPKQTQEPLTEVGQEENVNTNLDSSDLP